ncbi:DNA-directed DNA polymerase II small subunit [Candidatus Woesearchaeota archaeon]|nr:DNA-directed DNA polymerase II small subunit [Candidatus Woesearchaeota archaeon]
MDSAIEKKKKEIVSFFLKKGVLITEDLLGALEKEESIEQICSLISGKGDSDILVLNNDLKNLLCSGKAGGVVGTELEKSMVMAQKHKNPKSYDNFINILEKEEPKAKEEARAGTKEEKKKVEILKEYKDEEKKKDIQDFVAYFNHRYNALEKILRQRAELQNIMSIGRVLAKKEKETLSIIGIVSDKQVTKNQNIVLVLEDSTGAIKVHINKNKPSLYEQAKDTVLDEVVGVVGVNATNIIFANQLVCPDVPAKELKKSNEEVYAVFLSDLHVGSNNFLREKFERFIQWIRCETGNETQKLIAKKVKYVFIIGDLVDGVGVYPNQEAELVIDDIYAQYEACAGLLKKIPGYINIIICPGNHDAMRIAEPQPELYKDFAKPIWEIENAVMVTNPGLVRIHASEDFSGFDVLLYHGYSFDYFVANIDSIRNGGGYDRADLIMKFLLQKRHLAPTHTATLYIPDSRKDQLVIDTAPDIFATGHIHKTAVSNYKGVTMICGSCWQSKTSFQEKVGHHPEPCRVPIVNLKTRDVKILKFG